MGGSTAAAQEGHHQGTSSAEQGGGGQSALHGCITRFRCELWIGAADQSRLRVRGRRESKAGKISQGQPRERRSSLGCQVRAAEEVRAACLTSTASELTAAASGFSSPTTAGSPRGQRTSSWASGARTSARPTVMHTLQHGSFLTRSRFVPVQQFETRLTGLVLAAAQGDRI